MARPLWTCPRCGRTFANTKQTHTCAPPGDLDAFLALLAEARTVGEQRDLRG